MYKPCHRVFCSYARRTLDGALDAQCALIEFVHKLQTKPLTGSHILSLFDCSINVTKMMIDGQHSVVALTEDETELDITLLFQPSNKKSLSGSRSHITKKNCDSIVFEVVPLVTSFSCKAYLSLNVAPVVGQFLCICICYCVLYIQNCCSEGTNSIMTS